jgi:asparagine synthase (glutamine-hydrolysing)
MCGIFGYVGTKQVNLFDSINVVNYRGPDSSGYLCYDMRRSELNTEPEKSNFIGPKVLFGFRRLSIIDLDRSADQPLSIDGASLHIIFNGELYNYIEIREELKRLSHTFKTNSDTEVVLNAYKQWGEECVLKFNGMWAFAILDITKNKVFCSRDRFGEKPFYYYQDAQGFYFASEPKQLFKAGVKKRLNENVVLDYLQSAILDHTNQTFFSDVFSLPAGSSLVYDLTSNEFEINEYWKLGPTNDLTGIDYAEAKKQFYSLFVDSIRLRFRSNVLVGSCLSGGLDSSSIVSVATQILGYKLDTFTSKFTDPRYDESQYVNMMKVKHPSLSQHYCSLTEHTFLSEIDKVIYHQDEPFASMGILAQWEVMKLASANNVKVLLDGQGGDEVLGGYRKFYFFYLKELIGKLKFSIAAQELTAMLRMKDVNFFNVAEMKRYIGGSAIEKYLTNHTKELPRLSNIGITSARDFKSRSLLDITKYSYPILLRYEDRNSSAFSIESRIPFLDHRLIEFLHALPTDFLIHRGFTKRILRDSLIDVLPDGIRLRKSKLGFDTPQESWMGSTLNSFFRDYFKIMDNPYLNNVNIYRDFLNYPNSNLDSFTFFRFFCFDRWLRLNF